MEKAREILTNVVRENLGTQNQEIASSTVAMVAVETVIEMTYVVENISQIN